MVLDVIKKMLRGIVYWFQDNLTHIATFLEVITYYFTLYLGAMLYEQRGKFALGGELVIPFAVYVIARFLRNIANRIGKGDKMPKPQRRFTEEDEDGVISVPETRIQELLLYVADLEDWMEEKGINPWQN